MYLKVGKLAEDAYGSALERLSGLHRAVAGLGKFRRWTATWKRLCEVMNGTQAMVPLIEYANALGDL
jgi:hypothetical protein